MVPTVHLYINVMVGKGVKTKITETDKDTIRCLFVNLVELAKTIATRTDDLGLVLPGSISPQGYS